MTKSVRKLKVFIILRDGNPPNGGKLVIYFKVQKSIKQY